MCQKFAMVNSILEKLEIEEKMGINSTEWQTNTVSDGDH